MGEDLGGVVGCPEHNSVFVVTEKSVKANGLMDYVVDALKHRSCGSIGVYDEVTGVADLDQCTEIARLGKAAKAELWVAVGGGAAMDSCKVAAMLQSNGGDLRDYCIGKSGISRKIAPVVCVPTTPGSGFEVTGGALLADRSDTSLSYLQNPRLTPAVALLDAEVTRTLPAKYVASSGLTALCHAMNALLLNGKDPLSRSIAVHSIELVVKNVAEAFKNNSTDETCRIEMLCAATMAGMSLKGALPGLPGAISQSVCAMQKLHFGLSIGIATLHVLRRILNRVPRALELISHSLGIKAAKRSLETQADLVLEHLREIYAAVDVKTSYKDYGFSESSSSLEELMKRSAENPSMRYWPSHLGLGLDEMNELLGACISAEALGTV